MSFHKVSGEVRHFDKREPLLGAARSRSRGRDYSPGSSKSGQIDPHSIVQVKTTSERSLRERSVSPQRKDSSLGKKRPFQVGSRSPSPSSRTPLLSSPRLQHHTGADEVEDLSTVLHRNYQHRLGSGVKLSELDVPGIKRTFPNASARTKDERLMPTPDDPTVYMEDPESFGVSIEAFHDQTSYLSRLVPRKEVQTILKSRKGKPFESLDEAAEQIVTMRPPARISSAKPHKQKYFVTHSLTNQYDIISRPKIHNEQLRSRLGLDRSCSALHTQHVTLKNGFNGLSYKSHDGTVVQLKSAVAGSWDRESEKLQMGRRVAGLVGGRADPRAPSYCYTGRPDTSAKALEQGQMIFFGELDSSKPKGLTKGKGGVYTLDYAVNSIQLNADLNRLAPSEQEQLYFEEEKNALEQLRRGSVIEGSGVKSNGDGTYTLTDPRNGNKYKVRFRPMLFSRQVNWAAQVARGFDPWTTGTKAAADTTREGWNELKELAGEYLAKAKKSKTLSPEQQKLADHLIQKLDKSITGNCEWQMDEADELLCRTMLCMLLNLPIVWHCKSSTDRTSVVIAMNAALEQWVKLKLPIPEDFSLLLKDEYFKELFALNWLPGQQLTRNARSPDGIITQKGELNELDHEALGISINDGFAQCVLLKELLPERYLESHKAKQIVYGFLLTLFSPLTAFGVTLGSAYKTVWVESWGKWNYLTGLIPALVLTFTWFLPKLIYNVFKALFFSWRIHPDKVVNMDALGIGPRRLVKEAETHQTAFSKPLKAIPANAKNAKEYNAAFSQRFAQTDRPLRHFIRANLIKELSDAKDHGRSVYRNSAGLLKKQAVFQKMQNELDINPKAGSGLQVTIDRLSFNTPQDIFTYLTKTLSRAKRLDEQGALQLMCSMQVSATDPAHRHLGKLLDMNPDPTNPMSAIVRLTSRKGTATNPAKAIVNLDTKEWKLSIAHESLLRRAKTDKTHATIKSEVILNCKPGSDEFGHGYVKYEIGNTPDATAVAWQIPNIYEPFTDVDFS